MPTPWRQGIRSSSLAVGLLLAPLQEVSDVEQAWPTVVQDYKGLLEPANWLTLVRLPLAALLWVAPGNLVWLIAILTAAALTDMLDGKVARKLRARRVRRGDDLEEVARSHAVGAWLDPLCDKTFVVSSLLVVYVGIDFPTWALLAILTREFILVPCAIVYSISPSLKYALRFDFRAGILGKATTVAQFTALAFALMHSPLLTPAAIIAAVVGLLAALQYLLKAAHLARWHADHQFASTYWERMKGDWNQSHTVSRRSMWKQRPGEVSSEP